MLDISALQHLCVKIPKYHGEPLVQKNDTKILIQKFVHKCKQCEKFYTDIGSLVLHQIINHQFGKKNFLLEDVVETDENFFNTKKNNVIPDRQKTENQFEQFLQDKTAKEEKLKSKFECMFCGKSVNSEHAKRVHERNQHKTGGHTCKYCGKYFPKKVNGVMHEKRVHKAEDNKTKAFKCQICDQGFHKVRLY